MNRRELLTGLAAILPASALTVDVEQSIHAGDLVVITVPERHVSMETMQHVKAHIERLLSDGVPHGPKPKVLVLTDGCTLQVHRGIAKVELPER